MARRSEEREDGPPREARADAAPQAEREASDPGAGRGNAGAGPGEAGAESAALRAELEEATARWQRAAADYQNLRRRTQADIDAAVRRSLEPLLGGLLLVLDHLDMALASPLASEDAKGLAQGVRLTRDQLLSVLRQEGVEPIEAAGAFDPARHDAVATVEREDRDPGEIVEVVRPGYTWRGQVLRPAHVVVARATELSARAKDDAAESD